MDLNSIAIRVAAILLGIMLVVAAGIGSIELVRMFIFLLLVCVIAHFANNAFRRKEETNVVRFTITDPSSPYFIISPTGPGWDTSRTVHTTFQQVDITGPDGIVYITVWAPRPKTLVSS